MHKEPLKFKVGGLTLRGNLYKPKGDAKNLALLFIHGWTGEPNENAAKVLAKNGFWAMTFSLSGHNDSEGKIEEQTRQKSLNELIEAYDLFCSNLPKKIKIGVAGNSYGGYLAPLLAEERSIHFIQMRAPANYKDEGFQEIQIGRGHENGDLMMWRDQKLRWQDSRALQALHNFKGPVQIIESEFDDAVPHQTVQNYADAVKDKSKLDYHFMKGWPHSLGMHPQRNKQFQKMLINWANKIKLD